MSKRGTGGLPPEINHRVSGFSLFECGKALRVSVSDERTLINPLHVNRFLAVSRNNKAPEAATSEAFNRTNSLGTARPWIVF